MTKEEFIIDLHKTGAVKFGEFTLKSGHKSPFYFDLRDIISYPELLKGIAELLAEQIKNLDFDYISGVPYTALPIATIVADMLNKPLIYIRKEEKVYGTKNPVIGKFKPNSKVLLIDDLITTGESLLETAETFKAAGLQVKDFFVIIDRSNNAEAEMQKHTYALHSLIKLENLTEVLHRNKYLSDKQLAEVKDFTENIHSNSKEKKSLENELTKKLKEHIQKKKSNLVLSLDTDNQADFFRILEQTAAHIVLLKTHVDMLSDYDDTFILKLNEYAEKYDFMIFEDRKFADIGNTVRKQYRKGIYKIKDWAHFITVHAIPGEGILQGLFDGLEDRSSFLLAKMSSKGNLMNDTYTRKVFAMGEKHPQYVSGYICHATGKEQLKKIKNKIPHGQLMLMPGVKLIAGTDSMGQQYTTVKDAIQGGADCIIVGRGITEAENPAKTAEEYKLQAWKEYELRLKQ